VKIAEDAVPALPGRLRDRHVEREMEKHLARFAVDGTVRVRPVNPVD
jgi:hypothetical protein